MENVEAYGHFWDRKSFLWEGELKVMVGAILEVDSKY